MARFYLDEPVPYSIGYGLVGHGHDAAMGRLLGLVNAPDAAHLLRAAKEDRILVTHDMEDFLLLHQAWQLWFLAYSVSPSPSHAGILVIPQPQRKVRYWLPDHAVSQIDAFVQQAGPLTNCYYEWKEGPGWVKR